VKVQRPGIRDRADMDLRLMYRLAFLPDLIHLFGGTPTCDVIDEVAGWLDDELDYVTEAMNAFTTRENARFDPIEYKPRVWLDYSTARVLTIEYVEGVLMSDILTSVRRHRTACEAELRERGCDLDHVAANIVWNFINQVYAIGLFHADLHPAYLLVLPGNRNAYVDFGITRRLPADARASLLLFLHGAAQGRRGRCDSGAHSMG